VDISTFSSGFKTHGQQKLEQVEKMREAVKPKQQRGHDRQSAAILSSPGDLDKSATRSTD
jgi:hypothetical protein